MENYPEKAKNKEEKMKVTSEYHIDVVDKSHLMRIYMPYINNGGIFISTNKPHNLNDEVWFTMKLLEETDIVTVHGKVVWINPKYTQGGHPQGVGLQFIDEQTHQLRDKVENYLAGLPKNKENSEAM